MRTVILIALAAFLTASANAKPPHRIPAPPKPVVIVNQPVEVTGSVQATVDQPLEVTGTVNATVEGPLEVNGSVNAQIAGPLDVNVLNLPMSTDSKVPVTLIQRVNPDNTPADRSGDTTLTLRLCIGTSPCNNNDATLADRIRQGSDEILVVTSLSAYNFSASSPPPTDSYGMLNFGACRSGFFPQQFGVPPLVTSGRDPTHLTFAPGIQVSDLAADERLCFTGFAQSDVLVDAALHGYLTPRP
ncbi:MAG: hypothetical protein KDI68_16820 [Gammaproteobacteria bacterium]|nr:hypothetical protein [Gammaproteobacteria bacterium]